MSSPAPIFSDSTALLPAYYLPSAAYYATIMAYGYAVIDTSMRFDKRRKLNHRCTITDTQGELTLTVPIEKPDSLTAACWSDVTISSHGEWWAVHSAALQSAYGRTPFYEFYIDKFTPYISRDTAGRNLMEHNAALTRTVLDLLGIDTAVMYGTPDFKAIGGAVDDFRFTGAEFITEAPYYQIWGLKHGFRPGMSILDLIFNMGPESPAVLARMNGMIKSY